MLPTVAVVIPVFNEEAVLPELFARLQGLFDRLPEQTWRAILVDDGSRDTSAELVRRHAKADTRFELVELSRNFGFQAALCAGLARAQQSGAAAVITMDADLQDPPEVIGSMLEAWRNGAQVVRAVRRSRQETGLRRIGFDLFHRGFGRLTDFPIESNSGTFGLLDRGALEAFNALPERHRFFPGLRAWLGFKTAEVSYDRQERAAGQPQQNLRRLVRYASDGLFSFSYLPLRLLSYAGMLISGLGFCLGIFFIAKRLMGIETAGTGFTTIISVVTFLGGIQLIGIGILGEYLARVYDEVKQRPLYILKHPPGHRPSE